MASEEEVRGLSEVAGDMASEGKERRAAPGWLGP
jgi:hypothetical protein